ncbi:MAG: cell division protein FtsA [Endomicrobiaceae bacterium]|jgi:cell division protein FtsA|nr:cell division protein FtsA [Endomicrobiaceae bacterium]MDD3730299.1 cell division protein FtsA [Endomicrobiaceae bacterium]MDD4165978.1 cell division protein FtsA [Endomicrobiaceae bacterium]
MAKKDLILILDIGSSSVHGIIAAFNADEKKMEILDARTEPCPDGIKDGAVVGIRESARAIETLIRNLEENQNSQANGIIVSVRGSLIEAHNTTGNLRISETGSQKINDDNMSAVTEAVKNATMLDYRHEIIQIIPKEYIVDNLPGIQDPIGLECSHLQMKALVIVASKSNMENIKNAVNIEGLQLSYGYNALGDTLVETSDKELGCILVDIGGMTTGIAVYINKIIQDIFELPVGSDLLTKDITKKFRTTQAESKRIKETYGAVLEEVLANPEEEFEFIVNSKTKKATRQELVDVIKPAIDKQLEFILYNLEKRNIDISALSGGVILTGAGTKISGMLEAFEKAFDCGVKIANVNTDKIIVPQNILETQIYTTAITTLYSEYKDHLVMQENNYTKVVRGKKPQLTDSVTSWFKQIFEKVV